MREVRNTALAIMGAGVLLILLIAIGMNQHGFQVFLGELHVAILAIAHAAAIGGIILFFTGLVLGVAYVVIRLKHFNDTHVIHASKHGPAQAVISKKAVTHLQGPAAQMDLKTSLDVLDKVLRIANTVDKRDRMTVDADATKALPAGDVIPAVVNYSSIANQVPSGLSLLGIHPSNGNLEIVPPSRYKTTWFVGGSDLGKTNTVYGKVSDMVNWGARLIICDNHANKDDSLARKLTDFHHRLIIPVAQEPEDIKNAILIYLHEFLQRKGGKSSKEIWLITVDEVNGTANLPVKITDAEREMLLEAFGINVKGNVARLQVFIKLLAETTGYESRGFNMYGFYISQKVTGLSWLRNAMMTVFVHGLLMDSEALLAANNDRQMAEQVKHFKKGRTLVYGYDFDQVVLQQPLYEKVKQDHPLTYPNGELPAEFAVPETEDTGRPTLQIVPRTTTTTGPMHRPSSALTRELQEALDAYQPGMSYRELGKALGVNKDTAGKRLDELKRRKLVV